MIDLSTVMCLVTWPLNESEAGNLVSRVLSQLRDGRETAGNEGKLLGRSWLHIPRSTGEQLFQFSLPERSIVEEETGNMIV